MTPAERIAAPDGLAGLHEESQVVVIDHRTVAPENAAGFEESWAAEVSLLRRHDGFVSAQLRPANGTPGTYVSVLVWQTAQALRDSLNTGDSPTVAEQLGRAAVHRFGSVEVEPLSREVRKGGAKLRLTLKEYELLLALVSNPHRVFTRGELMDRVWGYRAALETGTLSVHMRRLRMKLEDDPAEPRYLETVWGIGYRFAP